MKRRLYFLFPNEAHAAHAVEDLMQHGIDTPHIHAVAERGQPLATLPPATVRQRRDTLHRVERWWWNLNLAVFFIALVAFLYTLVGGFSGWSVLWLAVAIGTFLLGLINTWLPDVRLDELRDALAHGEVLLMVDVPTRRVAEFEELVHRRHPEAAVGGVSWSIDALGF